MLTPGPAKVDAAMRGFDGKRSAGHATVSLNGAWASDRRGAIRAVSVTGLFVVLQSESDCSVLYIRARKEGASVGAGQQGL